MQTQIDFTRQTKKQGRHGQTEEQIDGTGGWAGKQTDQFEWLKTG